MSLCNILAGFLLGLLSVYLHLYAHHVLLNCVFRVICSVRFPYNFACCLKVTFWSDLTRALLSKCLLIPSMALGQTANVTSNDFLFLQQWTPCCHSFIKARLVACMTKSYGSLQLIWSYKGQLGCFSAHIAQLL